MSRLPLTRLSLSWRLGLRGLRRQLRANWLVVLLISVPVSLGVLWSSAQRTVLHQEVSVSQLAGIGDADVVVRFPNLRMGDLADPHGRRSFDDGAAVVAEVDRAADVLSGNATDVFTLWALNHDWESHGSVTYRLWTDDVVLADWDSPLAESAFQSIDGRLPTGPGEVALDRRLASGLTIGDTYRHGSLLDSESATIVGLVTPAVIEHSFGGQAAYVSLEAARPRLEALLETGGEGVSARQEKVGVIIGVDGLTPTAVDEALLDAGYADSGETPGVLGLHEVTDGTELVALNGSRSAGGLVDLERRPEQSGALITSALLVEAALLAAAAFAVRGRRRIGDVGRLSAVGAHQGQIQRMMLVEAALLGLCGAALGSGLMVVCLLLGFNPLLGWAQVTSFSEVVPGVAPLISGWDLVLPAVPAVGAAVLAAWLPARRAATQDPHVSLASATPPRQPVPRTGWLGAGLVVSSGLLLLTAIRSDGQLVPPGATVSALLALVGAVMAFAYLLLGWVERRGGSLPLAARLGVRQLARHRLRSVVLVGGVSVIAMVAVMMTTLFMLSQNGSAVRADSTLAVVTGGFDSLYEAASQVQTPPDRVLDEVRKTVSLDAVAELQAVTDSVGRSASVSFSVPVGFGFQRQILVATPPLMDLLGLDGATRATLANSATVVVTSQDLQQQVWSGDGKISVRSAGSVARLDVAWVSVPDAFDSGIVALIGEDHLPEGFVAASAHSGWLIQSTDGFSKGEREWLVSSGNAELARRPQPWGQPVAPQLVAVAIAGALMLVIARIASGLVAVESDRSTAVAVSVGAAATLRQRLLATQSAVITLMAVVLGVPLAVGFVWLLYVADRDSFAFWPYLDRPLLPGAPLYLIGALLLLPVVVAAFIGLTTRSASTAVSRRLT